MIKSTVWVVAVMLLFVNPGAGLEDDTETTTTSQANASVPPSDIHSDAHTNTVIERSSHSHDHIHVETAHKGFWAKKFSWRPRWVKTWKEKKIYVAVWKRMWGPVVVKEWVPVPRPPPGWVKHDANSFVVKKFPHLR